MAKADDKRMGTPSGGMVVAIDGPAGAGKSTVARAVAQAVGYVLVDTGAIYRTVALLALRAHLSLDDEAALAALAQALTLAFVDQPDGSTRVVANAEDVTDLIRSEAISRAAGRVAAYGRVRAALTAMQRAFAERGDAVLEGRDIGTVICPAAPVKIFLQASLAERARRRHEELQQRGEQVELDDIHKDLESRDARDRGRDVAPLVAAADAIHLDCTRMTREQVVATIVDKIRQVAAGRRRNSEVVSSARLVWSQAAKQPAAKPMDDERTVTRQANTVADFFALGLAARFAAQPTLVDMLGGTYLFVVESSASSRYYRLDCRETPVKVSEVEVGTQADCTLGASAATMAAMVEGQLHPQLAFMKGLLKVQGDLAMSMRLGALFS